METRTKRKLSEINGNNNKLAVLFFKVKSKCVCVNLLAVYACLAHFAHI